MCVNVFNSVPASAHLPIHSLSQLASINEQHTDWLHSLLLSPVPQANDAVLRACVFWPPAGQVLAETYSTGEGAQCALCFFKCDFLITIVLCGCQH